MLGRARLLVSSPQFRRDLHLDMPGDRQWSIAELPQLGIGEHRQFVLPTDDLTDNAVCADPTAMRLASPSSFRKADRSWKAGPQLPNPLFAQP
jgi:hypothetical protein